MYFEKVNEITQRYQIYNSYLVFIAELAKEQLMYMIVQMNNENNTIEFVEKLKLKIIL